MIMGDIEAIAYALKMLRPHYFKLHNHRVIFTAIAAVYRSHRQGKIESVDVITVCSQLQRMKEFGDEGSQISAAYLTSLIESCPSTVNIKAYVKPILETARLRSLFELADRLKGAVMESEACPEKLLNVIRNAADAIEQKVAPDLEAIFDKDK
jgi:replicative DNA helicase